MFRHSWTGAAPHRIHVDDREDQGTEELLTAADYSLVEDNDDITNENVENGRRGDSRRGIPLLESTSFRNIPIMQDNNRVVPLIDTVKPPRKSLHESLWHSDNQRHSEPGPLPTSAQIAPPATTFVRPFNSPEKPKIMTSGPELGFAFRASTVRQEWTENDPPLSSSNSLSSGPATVGGSELVIAYQPLNRAV
ncbi:hypothetical protein AeMF1_015137 [Aphanomyces euteiches]|nr:hypothetical protein AeMF1_015137 [Aphanomyces euteiches]KAH9185899.1 hypothetical protein AeNC1_012126 [Aphanomyces euteiches]